MLGDRTMIQQFYTYRVSNHSLTGGPISFSLFISHVAHLQNIPAVCLHKNKNVISCQKEG